MQSCWAFLESKIYQALGSNSATIAQYTAQQLSRSFSSVKFWSLQLSASSEGKNHLYFFLNIWNTRTSFFLFFSPIPSAYILLFLSLPYFSFPCHSLFLTFTFHLVPSTSFSISSLSTPLSLFFPFAFSLLPPSYPCLSRLSPSSPIPSILPQHPAPACLEYRQTLDSRDWWRRHTAGGHNSIVSRVTPFSLD